MYMSQFLNSVHNSFNCCDEYERDIERECVILRRCVMIQDDCPDIMNYFSCMSDYDDDNAPFTELTFDPTVFCVFDLPYTIFINGDGLYLRKDGFMVMIDSVIPAVKHAKSIMDEKPSIHSIFKSTQIPSSFFND